MDGLWQKMNYSSEISYLNNVFITEYDISKANINVLYLKGVIDKSMYDYLYQSERMVRQVYVGKLQRDNKEVTKILQSGIIEAKQQLFEANNIKDYEVLAIKNDAVFIINRPLQNTDFGMIKFIPKNVYTSFYRINTLMCKMEMYYYFSGVTQEEKLDIKGISNATIEKHKDHLYQAFKDIFYAIQVNGVEVAMRMLKDIYMQYVSLGLDKNFYRKFDDRCQFHLNVFTRLSTGYSMDNIEDYMKPMLDISYNMQILLELQKLLVQMYFNR